MMLTILFTDHLIDFNSQIVSTSLSYAQGSLWRPLLQCCVMLTDVVAKAFVYSLTDICM